jgi:hypothetical protein
MQPIDWMLVGSVALGAGVGTLISYRLMRNRVPKPRVVIDYPGQRAALLALAAFLGCALVEGLVAWTARVQPGGFFLAKYIFAAATGIGQFAHLRRAARIQASQARAMHGSCTAGQ